VYATGKNKSVLVNRQTSYPLLSKQQLWPTFTLIPRKILVGLIYFKHSVNVSLLLWGLSVPRGFPSKIPCCPAFEFPLFWGGRTNSFLHLSCISWALHIWHQDESAAELCLSVQPLECHKMLQYQAERKVGRNRCLERVKSLLFKRKSSSRMPANSSLQVLWLAKGSICLEYNCIKGTEKGCVVSYRVISVFGCCRGAWQHVNGAITSVIGSLRASHSTACPAGCALSESSTLHPSLQVQGDLSSGDFGGAALCFGVSPPSWSRGGWAGGGKCEPVPVFWTCVSGLLSQLLR